MSLIKLLQSGCTDRAQLESALSKLSYITSQQIIGEYANLEQLIIFGNQINLEFVINRDCFVQYLQYNFHISSYIPWTTLSVYAILNKKLSLQYFLLKRGLFNIENNIQIIENLMLRNDLETLRLLNISSHNLPTILSCMGIEMLHEIMSISSYNNPRILDELKYRESIISGPALTIRMDDKHNISIGTSQEIRLDALIYYKHPTALSYALKCGAECVSKLYSWQIQYLLEQIDFDDPNMRDFIEKLSLKLMYNYRFSPEYDELVKILPLYPPFGKLDPCQLRFIDPDYLHPGMILEYIDDCDMVEELIKAGVAFDIPDEEGITPLMRAKMHTALVLIKNGANIHARSKDGRSVLDFNHINTKLADDIACKILANAEPARIKKFFSDYYNELPIWEIFDHIALQDNPILMKLYFDVNITIPYQFHPIKNEEVKKAFILNTCTDIEFHPSHMTYYNRRHLQRIYTFTMCSRYSKSYLPPEILFQIFSFIPQIVNRL